MTITPPTEPIHLQRAPRHRADGPPPLPGPAPTPEAVTLAAEITAMVEAARGARFADDLDEIPAPPSPPRSAHARTVAPTVPPVMGLRATRMRSLQRWALGLVDPLSRPLPALGTDQEA